MRSTRTYSFPLVRGHATPWRAGAQLEFRALRRKFVCIGLKGALEPAVRRLTALRARGSKARLGLLAMVRRDHAVESQQDGGDCGPCGRPYGR